MDWLLANTVKRGLAMRATVLGVFLALLLAGSAERGLAENGPVALQAAGPSCADGTSNIYVDCGNGTVTDNRTGLVWLKNADCYEFLNWHDAVRNVANLSDIPDSSVAANDDCGLSDGSAPGEWRLPSFAEWKKMIADAVGQDGGLDCRPTPPTITTASGQGCWVTDPSIFDDVQSGDYWASSSFGDPTQGFRADLDAGDVFLQAKDTAIGVWPVRGGQ